VQGLNPILNKYNLKPSFIQYIYPISYKIAKKGKPPKKDLPFWKNDITRFYGHDMCILQWWVWRL